MIEHCDGCGKHFAPRGDEALCARCVRLTSELVELVALPFIVEIMEVA